MDNIYLSRVISAVYDFLKIAKLLNIKFNKNREKNDIKSGQTL